MANPRAPGSHPKVGQGPLKLIDVSQRFIVDKLSQLLMVTAVRMPAWAEGLFCAVRLTSVISLHPHNSVRQVWILLQFTQTATETRTEKWGNGPSPQAL